MKKSVTFLLLLVILAGSFYPCCVADDCCANEPALTHHEEGPKKEGACSPFFACATCAGFVETATPVLLPQPQPEKKIQHRTITVFHLTTHPTSFWQPPRGG